MSMAEKLKKGMISVVIPIYNAEKTLKKCIKSITSQNYPNIEMVCVNDGSRDGSKALIEQLAEQDSRIKLVDQENQGAFVARKNGVLSAGGEYVIFIDSDDEFIDRSAFGNLIALFEKEDDIQIVQFGFRSCPKRFLYKDKRNSVFGRTSVKELHNKYYEDFITNSKSQVISVSMCFKLYKTELVQSAARTDFNTRLMFGEDQLFLLMIIFDEHFHNMLTVPDIYYKYNQFLGSAHSVGYQVLKDYGVLKEYQNQLCDRFGLPEYAKFVCNLESVYFLRTVIFDMINRKKSEAEILTAIREADGYDCIRFAKSYFGNYSDQSKIWDELRFMASDYTAEAYYQDCLNKLPKRSLKSKLLGFVR